MYIYINRKAGLKVNVPVYSERLKKIMIAVTVILTAIAVAVGIACLCLASRIKRYTVEVGEALSASDIVGRDGASFGSDFDAECLSHPGVYYFTVSSNGEDITVRLKVKDTEAPRVTVKDVFCAVGGRMPTPEDFIYEVYEPDSFSGEFVGEIPTVKGLGTYDVRIRFTDASGNKTEILSVKMTQIYDGEPPVISVDGAITVSVGETVEYTDFITVTDNCIGDINVEADESGLDISAVGEYKVFLVATDAVGNKSERVEVTVRVEERDESTESLRAEIAKAADSILDSGMSREEQCRAIYGYVRDNVFYTGERSDRSDWRREAYRALFRSGSGDCFSFFSASKAFFEYVGIENLDIERESGYTADTHYWSLVNIGSTDEPRWYHFDATVLRADEYDHSGCLLTDAQIEAYCKVRPNFYRYDRTEYPESSEVIITRTSSLEAYY